MSQAQKTGNWTRPPRLARPQPSDQNVPQSRDLVCNLPSRLFLQPVGHLTCLRHLLTSTRALQQGRRESQQPAHPSSEETPKPTKEASASKKGTAGASVGSLTTLKWGHVPGSSQGTHRVACAKQVTEPVHLL